MTLLAPWFLIGLIAAGIPVLIHLRRSRRAKRIVFSTTRFFDEDFMRSAKRAQLQDRLLMLLRIALFCLFALALAQPLVKLPGVGKLLGWATGRRYVALVIDDSASMAMPSDRGLLLERAKKGALDVLGEMSTIRGDRATVVLAGRRDSGAKALFEEPTSDLQQVREAILAIAPTDLATDLGAAVFKAGQIIGAGSPSSAGGDDAAASGGDSGGAGGGGVSREVFVFSDLQQSAVAPGDVLSPGPLGGMMLVATRPDPALARQNVSVDAIQYGASRPMLGVPFAFRTLISNHSERPRQATVTLVVGGEPVSSKTLDLPAGRGRVVRFVHRFTGPGWYEGYVSIDTPGSGAAGGDTLASDNRRYFALQVQDRVSVLAINGAPSAVAANDEMFFFNIALTGAPKTVQTSGGDDRGRELWADGTAYGPGDLVTFNDRLYRSRLAHRGPGDNSTLPTNATVWAPMPIVVYEASPMSVTPELLRDYSLVVLANVGSLSPSGLEALERYVDGGGNLLITLGDRVNPEAYNNWIGENRLHGGLLPARLLELVTAPGAAAVEAADAGATTQPAAPEADFIASVDDAHPALASFTEGQLGALTDVRFTKRYRLEPSEEAAAGVIMRTGTGDALLVEKRFGQGRVMMFAASIDRDWTGFPLQPTYVPWVYRVVGYLGQRGLERAGFVRTGQQVDLPTSATKAQPVVISAPPDGRLEYPETVVSGEGAGGAIYRGTERAGVYAVRPATAEAQGQGQPLMLFAANAPQEESDAIYLDKDTAQAVIDPDTLKLAAWAYVDEPESVIKAGQLARQGMGLWNTLLMIALLVGLLEPWLANRISRLRGGRVRDALNQRDTLAGRDRTGARETTPAAA